MKTKSVSLLTGMLVLSILVSLHAIAQQPKYAPPPKHIPAEIGNGIANNNYTYTVFKASNKSFGYNVFLNGRMIFHQPSSAEVKGMDNLVLNKEQADKAASLSIAKIKNGMTPQLSREEMIKITAR